MIKPRCLVLDIETSPMLASIWRLKDQYINYKQLKQDWFIMAWGAKWLNTTVSKFLYRDQRDVRNIENDKESLEVLHGLLNQADFIMTQNGKSFDWPRIKARMMLQGMKPPSFFQHIDIYRELRDAGFTSHSLDYLTNKFCKKYKKLKHGDFPGDVLWDECLKGNTRAWNEMKTYNRNDVLSTEELFNNTSDWLPKVVYKLNNPVTVCNKCGSKSFGSNGLRVRSGKSFMRKFCKGCGAWQQEEVIQ